MRSRAQIFSGSAYAISASTWNSVTTTPSMTRWSTLGTRNCFLAVLRQSTASCSRTTVRWQRAVKLNVSEKAFRFTADAQGRCPASGLADAVRQPTASSAWRSLYGDIWRHRLPWLPWLPTSEAREEYVRRPPCWVMTGRRALMARYADAPVVLTGPRAAAGFVQRLRGLRHRNL